jgi:hypothetical protein
MPTVTFLTLPSELHLCIFQFLTPQAICALRETCRHFRDLIDAHRELVWRNIAIESSYLDEQTAPCTGCRVGTWNGSPDAIQGGAEELAAAIRAQKSGLGSFDDITTWTDFGACCLFFLELILKGPCVVRRRFEIDKRWRWNHYSRFFPIISPFVMVWRLKVDTDKRLLVTTSHMGTRILLSDQRFHFISFDPGGVVVQRLRDGTETWYIPPDETPGYVFSFLFCR